jgi:PAS domain S-box-containing protein
MQESGHRWIPDVSPEEGYARYRSLFVHTPHAAFSLDLEGRYEAVNPAACALTGYTEDEFLAMRFEEVIHPDDEKRVVAAFHRIVAREPVTVECGVRRKDGSRVEVALTGVPVVVGDEVVGVHGVAQNISDRHHAFRELEAARQVAEDANVAKSLFLANVSHELRTPLAGTVAALEMLEDIDMPFIGHQLLGAAQRGGERLQRLVDDLLDFISLASASARLRTDLFDPRETLRSVVEALTPEAEERGLTITVDVDPRVPEKLLGDPPRLARIADILLENAVKFTDEGGVAVRCLVVGEDADSVSVCLEVSDTGIGISPERHATLFDPFVQGDGSMTRRHGGTGLGLAILREMVLLHRGTYRLVSAPGQGTTVAVTIPLGRLPDS